MAAGAGAADMIELMDDEVGDAGAGTGAAGGPKPKRVRTDYYDSTGNVTTVIKWGTELTDFIWGFREDSDKVSRLKGCAWISEGKKLHCNGCGKCFNKVHKGDFASHLKTTACLKSRASGYRFDKDGRDMLLRKVDVAAAPKDEEGKIEKLKSLACALLLSSGVSAHGQQELFCEDAPVLQALLHIGREGLGCDDSIRRRVAEAVRTIEDEIIGPPLEQAVKLKLPLCVLMDGSTTKTGPSRSEAELVFAYTAVMDAPMAVDWVKMPRSPNAPMLAEALRKAITGSKPAVGGGAGPPAPPKYMGDEEYERLKTLFAADNASLMVKLAEEVNARKVSDPGHATALVIKAVVTALELAKPLKLVRQVSLPGRSPASHHGVHVSMLRFSQRPQVLVRTNANAWEALLRAFGLDPNLFKMPATRWAYITKLLRVLADTGVIARLQQLLLYVLKKGGRDVDVGALAVGAEVAADDDGDNDDDEDELEDEDEALLLPAGAKKKRDEKRLDLALNLLDQLLDPSFLCKAQVAYLMTIDLRKANSLLQTDVMSKEVLVAFESARLALESFFDEERRFQILALARTPLTTAAKAACPELKATAVVNESAVGALTVVFHELDDAGKPALALKKYVGTVSAIKAAELRDWKRIVAAGDSITSKAADAGNTVGTACVWGCFLCISVGLNLPLLLLPASRCITNGCARCTTRPSSATSRACTSTRKSTSTASTSTASSTQTRPRLSLRRERRRGRGTPRWGAASPARTLASTMSPPT
jgi:hypothetical protein